METMSKSTYTAALDLASSGRTNDQIRAWKSKRPDRDLVVADAIALRNEWAQDED